MSDTSEPRPVGRDVGRVAGRQRPLKVWGGLIHMGARGQCRTVVAATSQAKAAEALGCTIGEVRGWWSVSGNEDDCRAALSEPGRVFMASSSMGRDFKPVVRMGYGWVDAGADGDTE
jgi:hypothetical protein